MTDKFKMNFLIALPVAILTILLYWFLSKGAVINTELKNSDYSILSVLPYITVLVTAIAGFNKVLVLTVGIVMTGVIGISMGTIGFFEWVMALSRGMEDMFFLAVFSSLVSGLIELIKYYGGIEW